MMRTILFFLCLCIHGVIYSQTFSEDLQFDERVFDFGAIKEEDGIVSHVFTFKNIGRRNVFVNGVTSGCNCVQSEFSKEPVRPGGVGKVKVSYNPAYRPGFFSKEIVVLSNNNAYYNRIWIKGTVNPCLHPVSENYPYEYDDGLWMNFEVMAFGTIGRGKMKTMRLKYANDTNKDMHLMFVVVGGNTDIKFTSPRLVKAHEEGMVPITYQYSGRFPTKTNIYPVIDGKVSMKPLRITCVKP